MHPLKAETRHAHAVIGKFREQRVQTDMHVSESGKKISGDKATKSIEYNNITTLKPCFSKYSSWNNRSWQIGECRGRSGVDGGCIDFDLTVLHGLQGLADSHGDSPGGLHGTRCQNSSPCTSTNSRIAGIAPMVRRMALIALIARGCSCVRKSIA